MKKLIIKRQVSFKDKVLGIVKEIPKGKVLTYKEVALKAGNPRASRAVGNIMSSNKDKNVPCHRVIKSDGTLGKYNGINGEKMLLLTNEGYII